MQNLKFLEKPLSLSLSPKSPFPCTVHPCRLIHTGIGLSLVSPKLKSPGKPQASPCSWRPMRPCNFSVLRERVVFLTPLLCHCCPTSIFLREYRYRTRNPRNSQALSLFFDPRNPIRPPQCSELNTFLSFLKEIFPFGDISGQIFFYWLGIEIWNDSM